jgi:glycosyltransferase involved in cell wall biosynthesis
MNVVYFMGSIAKGGAEKLLLMLCSEFSKDRTGINPQLLVCEKKESDLYNDFISEKTKVTYLNSNSNLFQLKDFIKIYKWFIKNKPDVLHTHAGASMDRFVLLAAFIAGIKIRICTIHNMDQSTSWRAKLTYKMISFLSKKIVAVSNGACLFYKQNSFFNKNKMVVIYNCPGFSTGHIKPRTEGVSHKRTISIINVGGLRVQKGQLYLLEAMKLLSDSGYKFQLDIYGADRFGYGEILFKKVKELNLNNICFLGEVENIREKYEEADIFVSSSIREAMPLVILEAIVVGIPIIATDILPHKEILDKIPNNILIETSSGEAIAKAILGLVEDNKRYVELSKAELLRSMDFTVQETARKHLELYKKLS